MCPIGNHSKLAPSSAGQWVNCPGSVSLQAQFPEARDSDAAREGTASHEVAERTLSTGLVPLAGTEASNGVIFTEEMITNALVFVEEVRSTVPGWSREHLGYLGDIEAKVHATRIHQESWGTVDCWIYDSKTRTIYLWDYKYGYGIVDVYKNWQLINYAIGIIDEICSVHELSDLYINVDMRIVQPRPHHKDGPVRSWKVKASDLRGYANLLTSAAEKALAPDPPIKTGDHCRYCDVLHCCEGAQQAGYNAVDVSMQAALSELSVEQLGTELATLRRASKALEYRLTGIESHIMSLLSNGQTVPGWAIDHGQGRLKWNLTDAEVFQLGELMGLDLHKAPEPITPTQATKVGLSKEVVRANSRAGSSGAKLIPSNQTLAHKVFSKP